MSQLGGGHSENVRGVPIYVVFLGHSHGILIIYFWNPQLKPSRMAPLLGDLIKGGGLGAWS